MPENIDCRRYICYAEPVRGHLYHGSGHSGESLHNKVPKVYDRKCQSLRQKDRTLKVHVLLFRGVDFYQLFFRLKAVLIEKCLR